MDVVSVQQLVRMWADGREAGQSSGLNKLGRQVLWSGIQFFGAEMHGSCRSTRFLMQWWKRG